MKNISAQPNKILEDRNYRVAYAPRIITQWIAGRYYNHSEKNALLLDLLLISRLSVSQISRGENKVADVLDQHCAAFMKEVKKEFDTLKENNDGDSSQTLQTVRKLFPRMEIREINLPMLKTTVYREDGNIVTLQATPIVLVDDAIADSLNLNYSSREWLLAFGDHRRYNIYVVPMKNLEKFLDRKIESARRLAERLSGGNINHLGRPLSISQKMFTVLGCFWGLATLDTILKTNLIPLTQYWAVFMIVSLAVLAGALASIVVGGIKFNKARKGLFILPMESDEVLVPLSTGPSNLPYFGSTEQPLSDLPSYSTAKNQNIHLRAFKRSLREAKFYFENRAYGSYLAKAQSALYSALKAKHFELTNSSSDPLSFSQLVSKLRMSGFMLPLDKDIKKWTEIAEQAPIGQCKIDFETAKGYLLYLSKFVSSLKPFEEYHISSGSTRSKKRKEQQHKGPIPNVLSQA